MPSKSTLAPADLRLLDAFWREPVERTVLPNGLTLLLKQDRSAALASVQVWVKTGSIHEGAQLGAGLSHYLEHMLFKGTERRAGREISGAVQARGGYINAYTTFDRTVYYIDLPGEHAGFAIDVLADAVLHSTLPAEEATKEKDVILREIAMTRDDPDDRMWQSLFAAAFREHPYRHPVIGHRDVFSSVGRDDLLAYYRSRYVPNNIVVVIVGDVDPATARAAVIEHFGKSPRAALAPVLVPAEPGQLASRNEHRFEEVEISRAAIAWQIPGLAHPDAPVLDLLSMALGHGDSSILWQELREKAGLVHAIDASSWNPGTSGLFCISFTTDPDKRGAAEGKLEKVLARCATRGFTPGQLRKALRQLVAGEVSVRQTMSGQASRLGAAEVVIGDLGYSRSYFERLRTISPADLARVLRTYLVPEHRTSVSIDPSKAAASAAASASREGPAIPDVSEVVLRNGARLLLQPDHRLPNLHFRLLVRGGPNFERTGRRGSTALHANLLAKDTRKRSASEVAQFIEEVGGTFTPFFGNNSLGLSAEVLPPDADRALDLIADAVLAPAFLPSAFTVERDAQLAALREDADDVVTEARKLIRLKFFGSHPLALDARGDEAGVRALTPADLAALHARLFVAPNVVLAVAGDIPPGLTAKLKSFLAKLPRGQLSPAARGESVLPASIGDFVEKRQREQAVVLQAFPAPPLGAPDYYAGEVADELFSGMASRLFERVREEKALAYFVRSTRVNGLDAAMFCFLAGTQPGREDEVLAEIGAEIARVASGGVGEEELDRCKIRLKAARQQGLQTNAARAFHAGLDVLQGRPANDWKAYDSRVSAVSREDLARFASRYLQSGRRTQLVVRP
jgi:zinc protease